MQMPVRPAVIILGLLATHCQAVEPAARATQRFVVHVPPKATIIAPQNVQLVHDGTNAPQQFPAQSWQVAGTYESGLTVDFSTDGAFRNQQSADSVRDVVLGLTVGAFRGAANWVVVVARDQSRSATGDSTALVRAESDGPGRADLLLDVLFLTGDRSALPPGDYELTVKATVSANP
jgi:hypothetical protein